MNLYFNTFFYYLYYFISLSINYYTHFTNQQYFWFCSFNTSTKISNFLQSHLYYLYFQLLSNNLFSYYNIYSLNFYTSTLLFSFNAFTNSPISSNFYLLFYLLSIIWFSYLDNKIFFSYNFSSNYSILLLNYYISYYYSFYSLYYSTNT